jgi:exodeoxyribonuclease VII large subunit
LIIGRGGGSLEDLWAFNTEEVANAIYNSEIPIISAVGHETDFTISDFTADVRAATPTAAAELATPRTSEELIRGINYYQEMMSGNIKNRIESMSDTVRTLARRGAERRILEKINMRHQQIDDAEQRMKQTMKHFVRSGRQRSEALASQLKSLYPLSPLKKGFSIIKSEGAIIPKSESLKNYKKIEIIRENESARARIEKILPRPMFD